MLAVHGRDQLDHLESEAAAGNQAHKQKKVEMAPLHDYMQYCRADRSLNSARLVMPLEAGDPHIEQWQLQFSARCARILAIKEIPAITRRR